MTYSYGGNELSNDGFYETSEDHLARAHWQRVTETWETFGPDGEPVVTGECSREDAIFRHLRNNAHFSKHAQWLREHAEELNKGGHEPPIDPDNTDNHATALCGVRRRLHFETGSTWDVEHDRETLDELTEMANQVPCPHPDDRWQADGRSRRYCGRCGKTMKETA